MNGGAVSKGPGFGESLLEKEMPSGRPFDLLDGGSGQCFSDSPSLPGPSFKPNGEKQLFSGNYILAPGPRASPPFEIALLHSTFSYAKGRDNSTFILKVVSLCNSWILIKKTADIVSLVKAVKRESSLLDRVSVSRLASISPTKREERKRVVELIIATALNSEPVQEAVQSFAQTNSLCMEEYKRLTLPVLGTIIKDDFLGSARDGAYFVEHLGTFRGWKCSFFQVQMGSIIRTSVNTGRMREIFPLSTHTIASYDGDERYRCALVLEGPSGRRLLCANDEQTRRAFLKAVVRGSLKLDLK
jgi:hypothetical protein